MVRVLCAAVLLSCFGPQDCFDPCVEGPFHTIAEIDDIVVDAAGLPQTVPIQFLVHDDNLEPVAEIDLRLYSDHRGIGFRLPGSDLQPSDALQTWTGDDGGVAVEVVVGSLPVYAETGEIGTASVLVDIGVDISVVQVASE